MTAKTLTLLLLCAATLTQAAPGETLAEPKDDFPCPDRADIAPCICTEVGLYLNLDCSDLISDAELQRVFQAYFPFPDFTKLTIVANPSGPRINIVSLTESTFQNVTFSIIEITHTNLEFIHPKALDKSAPRLEALILSDNLLALFPFDVVDYSPFLTQLLLSKNSLIHMSEMSSTSLIVLDISYNPGLLYSDYALVALPNLEIFYSNDIELSHVGVNVFSQNTKLKYVDLGNNNLETLYTGTLNFKSPIADLRLNNNKISTVEAGAISGLGNGPSILLSMDGNLLNDLPKNVWEPVFNSVTGITRSFVFNGNPLDCSCNILWLVENPYHYDTMARGTICTNTDTDILDVDVDFLQANC